MVCIATNWAFSNKLCYSDGMGLTCFAMTLQQAIQRLEGKLDVVIRHLNYVSPEDERGGVELAAEILPNISHPHYVYKMAREGRIPYRKVNGRYLFSRLELEAWIAAGAPQPATRWAEEYRASLVIPEQTTDAA